MLRQVAAIGVLFCVLAGSSRADKRSDAKAMFEEGQKKFDVGKFDDAAAHWIETYELSGNPILLYNIAQAYRLGNSYEKALKFYKAYLRRDEKSTVRPEVEARMAEMQKLIEQQRKSNEAPPQGTIPEPPPPPETGQTKKPPPETPPPSTPPTTNNQPLNATPSPPTPPEAPKTGLRYAGYGLVGLAVASLAVAGAMSGLASSASSDVQHTAKTGGTFGSKQQSEDKNGPTYDNVAIAFYAIGGASAVAAGVLLYLGFRKPAASQQARLVPLFGPGSGGLAVVGGF